MVHPWRVKHVPWEVLPWVGIRFEDEAEGS
jgi:hypothetical protein